MTSRNDVCSLFNNDSGFNTCSWSPDDSCRGRTKEQCTCSGISYIVWAACDACTDPPINTTWSDYAHKVFTCSGLPQQFPLPLPTGTSSFASWAIAMASATPTPTIFDFAAASALVEPPLTSDPPPPLTTQSSSSTATHPLSTAPPSSSQSTATLTKSSSSSASLQPSSHLTTGSQSTGPSQSIPISLATSSPSIATSSNQSTSTPASATSNQALASNQRSPLPTGTIIGIVLGICLMILLAILAVWLRRRRQQATYLIPVTSDADTAIRPNAGLNDSDLSSTNATSTQSDTTADQEKPPSNAGSQGLVGSFSAATYPPARNMQVFTAFAESDTDHGAASPDVISQLREVTARVRQLEAQLESAPPEYSGEQA